MDMKERIKQLCKQRNISMNMIEQEMSFGKGYLSKIGKSTHPDANIKKIADYFGVTVDFLMTGKEDIENEKPAEFTSRDERDIAKDLENIMNKLSACESGPASYNGEDLDPEAADLFRDELEIALRRLKLINKEKYTNKRYKK